MLAGKIESTDNELGYIFVFGATWASCNDSMGAPYFSASFCKYLHVAFVSPSTFNSSTIIEIRETLNG